MQVTPVPAFDDNYIWVLHGASRAVVVDPGDAAPVLAFLAAHQLTLAGVLITHHHGDHTGGITALQAAFPAVVIYGAATQAEVNQPVQDGDTLDLGADFPPFTVLATPGHTLDHLSYLGGGYLFCGDTLFGGGCGRLFEGTPAQMLASLDRLAALPEDTHVCPAHEYTLSNLRFAQRVEGDTPALCIRLSVDTARRAAGQPTVPSTLAIEHATNPFLRVAEPAIWAQLAAENGTMPADRLAAFTALRVWKNRF